MPNVESDSFENDKALNPGSFIDSTSLAGGVISPWDKGGDGS